MNVLKLAALACFTVTMPAMATVVVDTGTPTTPAVGEPDFGPYYTVGSNQTIFGRFTANVNLITIIEGFFINEATGTQPVTAGIYTVDGNAPGQVIGSVTFDVPRQSYLNAWYGAAGSIAVVSGNEYYVGFSSSQTGGTLTMRGSAPNPLAEYGSINPSDSQAGYRTSALNSGIRINGETIAAVPETSTWAMMLAGFGAMGGTMRARRRQGAVA